MTLHDGYLETRVLTAPPYRLHLMVIDGALRHALRAAEALDSREFETAHQALNASRRFVGELIAGLDESAAPELVARMKGLFLFAHRNLIQADLRHDAERVRQAIHVLNEHRETWLQLGETLPVMAHEASDENSTERSWST